MFGLPNDYYAPGFLDNINQYLTPEGASFLERGKKEASLVAELGGHSDASFAIANALLDQGVKSVKDIQTKPDGEGGFVIVDKSTGKTINPSVGIIKSGYGGVSGGDVFLKLKTDASGNVSIGQEFSPRAGGFFKEIAPLIGVGLLLIPGLGQTIGASILGGSAAAVASAVGLSVTAVTTAVGAATLSAGMTALQGGTVEDVLKAGLSAGAAAGVNFAAGGGVAGAAAGSAVGTAIQGGDASQIVTNAFAAGVGAGVQGVMTENPDAGKIIGSAARTYIATGGDLDKTLLNTAATAIGTLDSPAKTEQQAQAAVTPASDAAAQETAVKNIEDVTQSDAARQQELADYQEKLNQYNLDEARKQAEYQEKIDQYAQEKAAYEAKYGPIKTPAPAPAPVPAPAPEPETTLAPASTEFSAVKVSPPPAPPAPLVSPEVTDLDLVKQVATQPIPTVDTKTLEQVLVQGQRDTANVANVAPVQTEITTPLPDTTRGLPPVTVTATTEKLPEPGFEEYRPIPEPKISDVVTDVVASPTPPPPVVTPISLSPVEVVAKADELPEPGFEEYKPLPEEKVSDVVTDVVTTPTELAPVTVAPPDEPVVEEEPPKKEEPPKEKPPKKPEKIYPTVTGVPPPKRPGRQPIITGASPARLLADALAAYRPAGAIEGEESGKERQNVWNEKSLRLKDALGL